MRIIRNSLMALGCLLALAGAIAGTASAASIAEWQIEGETMEDLGLKEETVKGGEAGAWGIQTKIGLVNTTIKCETSTESGKTTQEGDGTITVEDGKCSINVTGCSVSPISAKTSTELIENSGV